MNNGIHVMTTQQAQALLQQLGATLLRNNGASQVFVAKQHNKTLTVFANAQRGTVKVQIVGGCAC